MRKLTFLSVWWILLPILSLKAQVITPLTIGDTVPDLVLHHVINYKDSIIRLSDLRGKLVILDFWATWCTSCLGNFPRMDSLEKKYAGKLMIIGSSEESCSTLNQFFTTRKNKYGYPYRITSLASDTLLAKYFPHRLIPHSVWIDSCGVLRSITSGNEVIEKNIQHFLYGNGVSMEQKNDINSKIPLFISSNLENPEAIQFYTLLYKGFYAGLGTENRIRKVDNKVNGRALTNMPLSQIYSLLAAELFQKKNDVFAPQRVKYDRSIPVNDTRLKGEIYSFDCIVPLSEVDHLYDIAIAELNRLTPYGGHIKKQYVACYILKKKPIVPEIDCMNNSTPKRDGHLIKNCSLMRLAGQINSTQLFDLPILFEKEDKLKKVDIVLPDIEDKKILLAHLADAGLELCKEYRYLNTLVISKK